MALHWASKPAAKRWTCASEGRGCLSDPQNATRNGCWNLGEARGPERFLASPRVVDFPDLLDVTECPNSYVTPREQWALDAWECSKAAGIPLSAQLEDADAYLVQAFSVLEAESARIANSRAEYRRKQQKRG